MLFIIIDDIYTNTVNYLLKKIYYSVRALIKPTIKSFNIILFIWS